MRPAEIKAAVMGRETEILDSLGIRWRDGHPHIRCPYLSHLDKNPSWRWDAKKAAAFCTCTDRPSSIFDVVMRVKGGDFSRAARFIAEQLGRPELTRRLDKIADTEAARSTSPAGGCTLAQYADAKGLPEDFLRGLALADTSFARAPAI